jgi:hypothetical protein
MSTLHVEALQKEISALSDALARLGRGTTAADLLKIIHQPGWTTPAEFAFFKGMLSATQGHIAAIERLQHDMLEASRTVGR